MLFNTVYTVTHAVPRTRGGAHTSSLSSVFYTNMRSLVRTPIGLSVVGVRAHNFPHGHLTQLQ